MTGLVPTHVPAPLHASVCVQASPSLHAALVNEVTGHAVLAPSHVPFTLQTFPSLQVVPAAVKVQLAVQQLVAAPFAAPRSQSSPASSTPFPQSGAILPMMTVNWSVWIPPPNPGPWMRKKLWLQGLPVSVWAAAGLPIEPAGGGAPPVAKWRNGPTSAVSGGENARATPAEAGMRAL